jgi:3-hydroxyisobutyrate dehydrogenase
MRSAIIGMGEVGCTLYEALQRAGFSFAYVADKQLSKRALQATNGQPTHVVSDASSFLPDVDLVLSCVEGETAAVITRMVSEHGRKGQVLIDFSTASADVKKQAALLLSLKSIEYVDVAIMGAIALTGAKTNMIAAGIVPNSPSQQAIERLVAAGLSIKTIANSQAGDAISLKLLRSIFTKGLEALTTECLAAAEHLGVRQSLYDVLSDVDQTHLPTFLEMLVSTHVVHAARRKKEVQRAHEQLHDLGLGSLMLPAVVAVFERTERLHDRATTPEPPSADRALAILTQLAQQTHQDALSVTAS